MSKPDDLEEETISFCRGDLDEKFKPDHLEEKTIPFGLRELDEKLGGGIPHGSFVLIDGRFEACKSLVSQQFVWGALQAEHHVVLYATEHDTLSLLEEMERYGMDATDQFLLGSLNIYPIPSDGHNAAARSFALLHEHFSRLVDFDVVVVDALTTFMSGVPDEEILSFFTTCREHCSRGKTVTVTVHSHSLSTRLLEQARSICNVHLRLRVEQSRQRKRAFNVLEIAMVRDAELGESVMFEAEPGYGMKALPFSTLKAG